MGSHHVLVCTVLLYFIPLRGGETTLDKYSNTIEFQTVCLCEFIRKKTQIINILMMLLRHKVVWREEGFRSCAYHQTNMGKRIICSARRAAGLTPLFLFHHSFSYNTHISLPSRYGTWDLPLHISFPQPPQNSIRTTETAPSIFINLYLKSACVTRKGAKRKKGERVRIKKALVPERPSPSPAFLLFSWKELENLRGGSGST